MLVQCWEVYRATISGGCFVRVLKNAMFGLMQLFEYIKTVWGACQSGHCNLHISIRPGNTAGVHVRVTVINES